MRSGMSATNDAQAFLEARRHVVGAAADLEVAGVHALAGDHLEQVERPLALAERVEEDRDRAELEAGGPEPDQVRGDAVQLAT